MTVKACGVFRVRKAANENFWRSGITSKELQVVVVLELQYLLTRIAVSENKVRGY